LTARDQILHLQLLPHPEGGFYKETYRSAGNFNFQDDTIFDGSRSFSTAIYYLLEQGDFSAFHRIRSDECWHFYAGECLHIHILHTNGEYELVKLGSLVNREEVFQYVVPGGAWFASEPAPSSSYCLTGCTVAPGFDFADFEMAQCDVLLRDFPDHEDLVRRLCR
jgi:uncharacterized protein